MAENKTDKQAEQLLTKMECRHLFCEKLKIGKTAYYEYYRPYIKFKSMGRKIDKNGKLVKSIPRIPRKVAIGLINLLGGHPKESDPDINRLKQFLKNGPEIAEKS